jgi:hypothetical protein
MLFEEGLARAEDFVWNNARLLERTLFRYLFRGGQRAAVVAALAAYQNPDGGFGNALEPDKRCPDSQPQDVEFAFRVLDWAGGLGVGDASRAMVSRACDFLQTVSTPEGGVPFGLPSARAYPHQPWWDVPAGAPAGLNPTASILGLLLKHGIWHPWMGPASEFCWQAIARAEGGQFHDLIVQIWFLEYAPDRPRAEHELARIAQRVLEPGLVTYDLAATGYVKRPLDWAPTPDSYCRRLFGDDVIAGQLAGLAARQQADGGWPISWVALSPGSELEWRGWVTLEALRTLRAYGA